MSTIRAALIDRVSTVGDGAARGAAEALTRLRERGPGLRWLPEMPESAAYRDLRAPDAVLVGDAGDGFGRAHLNRTFRVSMAAGADRDGRQALFPHRRRTEAGHGAFRRRAGICQRRQRRVVGEPRPRRSLRRRWIGSA